MFTAVTCSARLQVYLLLAGLHKCDSADFAMGTSDIGPGTFLVSWISLECAKDSDFTNIQGRDFGSDRPVKTLNCLLEHPFKSTYYYSSIPVLSNLANLAAVVGDERPSHPVQGNGRMDEFRDSLPS